MSSAKFAAITASLLARKGDAAPSAVAPAPPPRPTLVRRDDQRSSSEPPQPDNVEKLRRIMVCITPEQLERLSIAAIKKSTNRHDIVRHALDDYFRKLSAEFPQPCACLEGGSAVAECAVQSEAATHNSHPISAEQLDSAMLAMPSAEEQVAM